MTATSAKASAPIPATHRDMANAIRALAMDAVEQAASGHPGMPMGMADVATVLFRDFLKFDPLRPEWPDRDRFVLSAGHGSMLQYALMHLVGYEEVTIEEIRNFRQLGAKTAGHPEYGHIKGIETTTGPLGQGLANAVGMALAERMLAARFGMDIVDHSTYAIVGDGCLMEGISQEAISLAGHLKLHKLIVLWDDNGISIDGPTSLTITEDTPKRFEASGWDVQMIDGHDEKAIRDAIATAQKTDTPSMIACKTTIAYGAPTKAGKNSSHGSPLGKDEIVGARSGLGWAHEAFHVPPDVMEAWRAIGAKNAKIYDAWHARFTAKDETTKENFGRMVAGALSHGWEEKITAFKKTLVEKQPNEATRKSSELALEVLTEALPEMIGGSADLTGSNNTKTKSTAPITPGDYSGRYIYYGIREHAMGAIMNGISLHGGFIPYSGTFLVFADYMRPAIRLSALMGQRVIYVMTHDSIGLGEDGPTHQPVEHLASLRAIPNLEVFRPADATETAECWAAALANQNGPSLLSLSRQNLPNVRKEFTEENLSAKGGYVLSDYPSTIPSPLREEGQGGGDLVNKSACFTPLPSSPPRGGRGVVIIATGSEVHLALEAQEKLKAKNIAARVVSMPSWELFDVQPREYRRQVLGENPLMVAVEAASGFGWEKYLGENGIFVGMTSFGASAPAPALYKHFGITSDAVVEKVLERVNR